MNSVFLAASAKIGVDLDHVQKNASCSMGQYQYKNWRGGRVNDHLGGKAPYLSTYITQNVEQ